MLLHVVSYLSPTHTTKLMITTHDYIVIHVYRSNDILGTKENNINWQRYFVNIRGKAINYSADDLGDSRHGNDHKMYTQLL